MERERVNNSYPCILVRSILLILFVIFLATPAKAGWKLLKTPHFTCFYPEGYQWEAEQALSNLEYYREEVVRLTGNREIGNLPVVIEDVGIMANGFADPLFKLIFTHIFYWTIREEIVLRKNT